MLSRNGASHKTAGFVRVSWNDLFEGKTRKPSRIRTVSWAAVLELKGQHCQLHNGYFPCSIVRSQMLFPSSSWRTQAKPLTQKDFLSCFGKYLRITYESEAADMLQILRLKQIIARIK